MNYIQYLIVTAGLMIGVLPAALGQATLNADGFNEKPVCSKPEIIQQIHSDVKQYPSGMKASSPRFELEIYPKTRSDGKQSKTMWGLVGDNRKGQLCILAGSDVSPYVETSWYQRYFRPDNAAQKQ